ncbi:stage III sporulation protein AA [Brassicibacter mesophilus]|uniref:stage III sporulation protein AA n=1 Tax=Brassicibacter mesophilus TaxID=745119 RepID=UPI003D22A2F9
MNVQMNSNFKKKKLSFSDNSFERVIEYLDPMLSDLMSKISLEAMHRIEEIRLRTEKPLMVCMEGLDFYVTHNSEISEKNIDSYIVSKDNIVKTFQILCNYSIYSIEEELRNGFITIKGGHRVGIAGKAVYGKGGLETIKDISSLNLRIARQKIGVSDKLFKHIIKKPNTIYHTLIVSPPQCGKTTMLRDLIRNISDGVPRYSFRGIKVGIVDERSELGGLYRGSPQNNVGVRTDILDGCQKYDGIIILLRSMSPNVIATDELGGSQDIKAIHEAIKAGVKIIATVHGEDINDICSKPNLREIVKENIFERIIILDNSQGVGTVRDIIDGTSYKSII